MSIKHKNTEPDALQLFIEIALTVIIVGALLWIAISTGKERVQDELRCERAGGKVVRIDNKREECVKFINYKD